MTTMEERLAAAKATADEMIRQQQFVEQSPDNAEVPLQERQVQPPTETLPPVTSELDALRAQLATVQAETERATQQWKSLQGILRSKDEQIKALQEVLAQVQKQPEPQKPSEPAPVFTQEEIDSIGPEYIDVMQRVASQTATAEIAKLKAELDALRGEFGGVTQSVGKTKEQMLYAELDRAIPGWEKTADSPDFATWLQEVDHLSGYTRQQFFADAAGKYDANRVVQFFRAFEQTRTPPAPALALAKGVEKMVAPGKSHATHTQAPANGTLNQRVWSREDIAKLYRNKIKTDPAEFKALEADLFAAQREGRITS